MVASALESTATRAPIRLGWEMSSDETTVSPSRLVSMDVSSSIESCMSVSAQEFSSRPDRGQRLIKSEMKVERRITIPTKSLLPAYTSNL